VKLQRLPSAITAALLAVALVAAAPAADRPGPQGPPDDRPTRPLPPGLDRGGAGDDAATSAAARVVVAAIDSAMNPYHGFFHGDDDGPYVDEAPSAVTAEVLAELGVGPDQILSLTRTGDMEADLAADAEQWERVEPGVLYWFEGTNVLGISFDGSTDEPLKPTTDKNAHGVGVTAAVLEANPDAVTILVEGISDDSEEWAFTHPSVDIVTTSYGFPASPPVPYHLHRSYTGVVGNGKLHFGAVDNSPAPSQPDSTGGPWWSIGVAGFQEDSTKGRQLLSGTASDVVGNFTQTLPYCMDCQEGRREVAGTSFATPTSAGTASHALLLARQAVGHAGGIVLPEDHDAEGSDAEGSDGEGSDDGTEDGAEAGTAGTDATRPLLVDGELDGEPFTRTNWELRRALEEAAVYPGFDEWDPTADAHPLDAAALPVLDAAPWLTTGWGLVTADPELAVVPELLAHLGVDGEPTRTKSADACLFNTINFEVRYYYWNHYALLGESWLEDDDPYLRC
jgi:hypothetical protein